MFIETQTARRPPKLTLTFKLVRVRDQTCLHVNLLQIRSAVPEIFHTQTKKSDSAKKQNLMQFTVCCN